MIALTRLDGSVVHVNGDQVQLVETHHDTVVTLLDGRVVVAREPAEVVVARVVDFRGRVLAAARRHLAAQPVPDADAPAGEDLLDGGPALPADLASPTDAVPDVPHLVVVPDSRGG